MTVLPKDSAQYVYWILGGIAALFAIYIGFHTVKKLGAQDCEDRHTRIEAVLRDSMTILADRTTTPTRDSACCPHDGIHIYGRSDPGRQLSGWLESLKSHDVQQFTKGFLSYELTYDIGSRLADRKETVAASILDLNAMLDSAAILRDPVLSINLIELAGNLAMFFKADVNTQRKCLIEKIKAILNTTRLDGDLVELGTLKLAVLSGERGLVADLIPQIRIRRHSFYQHGIFEDSKKPLELVLSRDLGTGGRLYAGFLAGFICEATPVVIRELETKIQNAKDIYDGELVKMLEESKLRLQKRMEKQSL